MIVIRTMSMIEPFADISAAADAATLPELLALKARFVLTSERIKKTHSQLNDAGERTGLIFNSAARSVSQPQTVEALRQVGELQGIASALSAAQQDLRRQIEALTSANADAVAVELEPFRRRSDARLLAARNELTAALNERNVIIARLNQAGAVKPKQVPSEFPHLDMVLNSLGIHVVA